MVNMADCNEDGVVDFKGNFLVMTLACNIILLLLWSMCQ